MLTEVTTTQIETAQIEQRKNGELSQKMIALGQLATNLAHEISSPLTAIQENATVIRRLIESGQTADPRLLECCSRLERAVGKSASIVQSLKGLARKPHKDAAIAVDLLEALNSSIELCEHRLRSKNISLETIFSQSPVHVLGRSSEIGQIVVNLLNNAIDAITEHSAPWIQIHVNETDTSVKLSFIDSGPGISQNIQAHIFEPYFTTKPPDKGTGLGLGISKSIANAMGGDILLDPTHKNTCFVVYLRKPSQ